MKGNPLVELPNHDNPVAVPFLFNCKNENAGFVCNKVPLNIQSTSAFAIDAGSVEHPSDIFYDNNGIWNQTKTDTKYYTIIRSQKSETDVISIRKADPADADCLVKRRSYCNASYNNFRRLVITIETSASDGELLCDMVLVAYSSLNMAKEKPFAIKQHGNSKTLRPYIRLKPSARSKLNEFLPSPEEISSVSNEKLKHIFNKQHGGITGAEDVQSLAMNTWQVKYEKFKKKTTSDVDPIVELASALNLQSDELQNFVRHVNVSQESGYYVLCYTDVMIERLIECCATDQSVYKQPLSCDVKFNIGPYFVYVATYKWPVLEKLDKEGGNPVIPGFIVIMHTLSSTSYCHSWGLLLGKYPGLKKHQIILLRDEDNVLGIGPSSILDNVMQLQCFIHCKRNISDTFGKKGLKSDIKEFYLNKLFEKDRGVIHETDSLKHIERMDSLLLQLEVENSDAAKYVRDHKLEELRYRVGAHVMTELGTGTKPLTTNVPECFNAMIENWIGSKTLKADKCIRELYDICGNTEEEIDKTILGGSTKHRISPEFGKFLPDIVRLISYFF